MNKMTLIFCLSILFACGNNNQKAAIVPAQTNADSILIKVSTDRDSVLVKVNMDSTLIKTLAVEFNTVNTWVRDNKIDKAQALEKLQDILPKLQTAYNTLKHDEIKKGIRIFPVEGYSSKAIGGTHGEGYIPDGYDYFDGNRHGGHPAQDIFIHDRNQDSKDDRTGKFVNVCSVSNGIVVASENNWNSISPLRGGKYIWIYDPDNNSLFYYAHTNEVLVNVGQIINAGDPIATVGRTGLNAFKQRSPTHLHFMELALDKEFYPKPVNTYRDLLKAETK